MDPPGAAATHSRAGKTDQPHQSPRREPTAQPRRHPRDDGHAGGLLNTLRHADPADKTEVYRELGVRLTYNHTEHTVLAETRPTSSVCVVSVSEGGLDHYAHVLNQHKLLVVR